MNKIKKIITVFSIVLTVSLVLPFFALKVQAAGDYTPQDIKVCKSEVSTDKTTATIRICWSTKDKSNSEIVWGLATETLDSKNNKPNYQDGGTKKSFELTDHYLTLTGLKPGTKYKYVVRSRPDAKTDPTTSPESTFTTPNADGTGGDTGAGGDVDAPAKPAVNVTIPKIIDKFEGRPLSQIVLSTIKIIFLLMIMAAVVVIMVAGFRMATGGNNPDQLVKSKKTIVWAIIGMVVAFMAYSIVEIISNLLKP